MSRFSGFRQVVKEHWIATTFACIAGPALLGALLFSFSDEWSKYSHEAQAAWVQAFGSVGAILAAAFIAVAQSDSIERRLRKQSESKAFAIAVRIRAPLNDWFGMLPKIMPSEHEEIVGLMFEQRGVYYVPKEIRAVTMLLPTLGEDGIRILRAMSRAYELRKLYGHESKRKAAANDPALRASAKLYWDLMRSQVDDLREALTNIVNLIDA